MALTAALTFVAQAAEGDQKTEEAPAGKKSSANAEQKALRKELTAKYDTNKNGRLDSKEKSKMTPEDQEKWKSVASASKPKADAGEKKAEKKTEKKP